MVLTEVLARLERPATLAQQEYKGLPERKALLGLPEFKALQDQQVRQETLAPQALMDLTAELDSQGQLAQSDHKDQPAQRELLEQQALLELQE
jgi:hypothetical protein